MVKFLKIFFAAATISQLTWADPALDSVIDDLQKGSGSYYSSYNKFSTTKNYNDYLQQKFRQLAEKYMADQKKLNQQNQKDDINFITAKLETVKNLSQRLSILLKSHIFYPQNLIFKTMSPQGQIKYSQGQRIEIPDLENGFDILSIAPTNLNETDRSILEKLIAEVKDLVAQKNSTASPAYSIKRITGISLSYDDILNNLLSKIDNQDYTTLDREAALRLQLNLLDNLRGNLLPNDQNISRLQSLRNSISSDAEKFPMTVDDLVLFLQIHYQDPTTQLGNNSANEWLNQKKSFAPSQEPKFPTLSNLTNLSFDVVVGGETITLSAKTIDNRTKQKQRFYSQTIIYKSMSPAAQADYRSGKRYTFDKSQLMQDFFIPLDRSETDTETKTPLEKLATEIKNKLKSDLGVKKAPDYQIIDIRGANFDYDQILNAILTDIENIQNRPNDRQDNLVIDLGIIDKYLQQIASTDKAYQSLLTLRQKVESGQDGSTRTNYPSQQNQVKNQSQDEWNKIQQQLMAAQPAQTIKITNLGDVTLTFKSGVKTYTISPADIGSANYAKRRLATSNKFSKEKSDIFDQLVSNLTATNCNTRDECQREYSAEIKAMKTHFGRPAYNNSYNTYGSTPQKRATPVTQEIDAAILEMLGNFETILANAFNQDRPQTRLMLYNKLSKKGQTDYLSGTRIADPKEAKIFKVKSEEKKSKKKKSKFFDTILSLFGGDDGEKKKKEKEPKPQPDYQVNQEQFERQLRPLAFFDTDDILLYAIQLLEKTPSTCRTYSDCANSDIRTLNSLISSLNQKDPVINFLLDTIDNIKEKYRVNPIDLNTISQAFKNAKYSTRLKLESGDTKTWEEIESKRSKTRKTAIPPRITNANELIRKTKQQTAKTRSQPSTTYPNTTHKEKPNKSSQLNSTINNLFSGGLGGTVGGILGGQSAKKPTAKQPVQNQANQQYYNQPPTYGSQPPTYAPAAPSYSPSPQNSYNNTQNYNYNAPTPSYGSSQAYSYPQESYDSYDSYGGGYDDYSHPQNYGSNQDYNKPSSQRYAETAF